MATQAPLSTYVTTPEGEERVRAYKEAQDNLRQALESRQNQLFDPTLLAISQALGSPTKTGSFGEVLGNVAGAVGTAQEAEQKRARDIANMKFEVARNELQSYQTTESDKEFRNILGGMLGKPPVGAAPAGVAPASEGVAPAPAGALTGQAPGRVTATPAQVLQLSDPRFGGKGDAVVKALNYQRGQIVPTAQGPFDVDAGKFVDVALPNEEQKPVTTPYGKFDLFPSQVRRFYEEEQKGNGRQYLQSILTPKSKPADGTLPPDAAARELETKRKTLTLEGDVKSDTARKEDIINKSVLASNRLPSLSSLEQFALSPDSSKLLGVFEGSSLGQAIAKMAEPTMPQIREAFTQYGLPEGVKADQGFALQQIALINSEIRKVLRAPGEGAQSDMENRAALAAGLDKTDTPGALLKKVRFLKAQSEFQRDLGRELNASKETPTAFLLSDNYDRLLQTYEKKLNRVLGLAPQQARPSTPSSPRPTGNYGPAQDALNKKLRINQ
jgi:hypothetical protein